MLCQRDMLQTNLCLICNQNVKTTLQCVGNCEFFTRFWKSIGFLDPLFFQGDNLYDWELDMTSIVTLSFWLFVGGYDVLRKNYVLQIK